VGVSPSIPSNSSWNIMKVGDAKETRLRVAP
jgi:hypothetical protein